MVSKSIIRKRMRIYSPLWMIMGAVVILLAIVVVLGIRNVSREERYMSRILSEKGAALIKSFEAGTRTGMMGMMWGADQVQTLLEETARQPGILYLAVTDSTGSILAHSERARIGQKFRENFSLKALSPDTKESWRLTDYGGDPRSFEVYRYFHPWDTARGLPAEMCGPRMMRGWQRDWCFPSNRAGDEQIIFVGLDVEPFESARKEDIGNTIIISAVLLLLGFGGFLSLFWAQSYRTTKRLLQDTSAFSNEVVSNLPVGLIATDREGRIAFFNEAAEKITGLNFHEVRGKDSDEFLPSQWCGLKEVINRGQTILEQEMECTFPYREAVPVSVSASRIVNEEGDFVGNMLILRDLGEVRNLQAEIRRKEKLAALGSLAAGVAHEIRNPLSSIKGLATYFAGKFAEGTEDRESAGVMVREVDRLNRVITELLEFARPSELKRKSTDMNAVLEHSLRLVQQDAKTKNIDIKFSKEDNLPQVFLDPDRVSQALLNLYLNGIQAMDKGGSLSVRTWHGSDETVQIEVSDTGKGLDSSHLERVFDPYFTTKPKGTGLGLAIVHKIIEAHDGNIKIRSAPGKGTSFIIVMPIDSAGKE